jgi:hypothetical protein
VRLHDSGVPPSTSSAATVTDVSVELGVTARTSHLPNTVPPPPLKPAPCAFLPAGQLTVTALVPLESEAVEALSV